MAVQVRAKAGGQTVGGKFFKGGQFVTQEALSIQAGLDGRSVATGKKKLDRAIVKAAFSSFAHAAASIRKDIIASIKGRKKPGPPGGPVRTRSGKGGGFARRSVLFWADKTGAVIGFSASRIDQAMEAHEHGRERGGVLFPKRPTAQPALERNLARFHREWRGAI